MTVRSTEPYYIMVVQRMIISKLQVQVLVKANGKSRRVNISTEMTCLVLQSGNGNNGTPLYVTNKTQLPIANSPRELFKNN